MTLKRNGTATIIGIYEKPQIQIPASRFVTHEIHVQGAQGYCWDFPIAIAAARDIPLENLSPTPSRWSNCSRRWIPHWTARAAASR